MAAVAVAETPGYGYLSVQALRWTERGTVFWVLNTLDDQLPDKA